MLERFLDQIGEVLRLCEDTDGILVVNREGIIEYHRIPLNSYWCSQDTVGRHILELYPELDGESSTILTALRTGRASYNVLQDINNHRGERVLLESTTIPIVVDGRVECVVDSSKYHTIDQRVIRGGEGGGLSTLDRMLTEDPAMLALKSRIRDVAGLDSSVLIYGETGTGKELFAQAIHNDGPRRNRPFVAINCGAIPKELLESELFGYEEGAFTGAQKGGRPGKFELADTGTLFLDEIGDLPLTLQGRLLRVLQERELVRVGGTQVIPLDVRVLCATHQDLRQLVAEERFRADLFYRLNVLSLRLPPLRERLEDIVDLAVSHLREHLDEPPAESLLVSQLERPLLRHPWPGNIRELLSLMERMAIVANHMAEVTDWEQLLLSLWEDPPLEESPITPSLPQEPEDLPPLTLRSHMAREEARFIRQAVARCGGDMGKAAHLLGISRMTLWRKLQGLAETNAEHFE